LWTLDANGYTSYQDLVLAVKPLDYSIAHKKYLREKAQRQSNPAKLKAEEFREYAKGQGTIGKIDDKYEDD
jgi:hypothetical protein